jgi:hypothetical protein
MKKLKQHIIYLILTSILFNSCIEPITLETTVFEDSIVIEALITNELKNHEINITRTFQLEESNPIAERNARVEIIDATGIAFSFEESEPGKYISVSAFAANPNNTYQLSVITNSGDVYTSKPTPLTNETEIENINVVAETDENGVLGASIYANSFDLSGNSRYYRYEYEETYKIVAPFWSKFDAVVIERDSVSTVERTQEEKICYNTVFSADIIQTQTNDFSEDRVTQKLVRFIPADDFILSNRYSILVKQYVQTFETYNYLKTIKDLSNSENLLSQNQPGFISSNIVSVNNPNEKVLGFFDVSSVSTRRLFFNFADIFPSNQKRPEYFVDCELFAPRIESSNNSLIDAIQTGSLIYYTMNFSDVIPPEPPVIPNGGPYVMVIPECGDCTTLGSNIVPDFWEE